MSGISTAAEVVGAQPLSAEVLKNERNEGARARAGACVNPRWQPAFTTAGPSSMVAEKREDRKRTAPTFFTPPEPKSHSSKPEQGRKHASSVETTASFAAMGVLEWLEAEADKLGAGQTKPALAQGIDAPERPPAPELLFLHKIRASIKQPATSAWTAAQLADGVAHLFDALPSAQQQAFRDSAKASMNKYQADHARIRSEGDKASDISTDPSRRRKIPTPARKPAVAPGVKQQGQSTARVNKDSSTVEAPKTAAQDCSNVIFPRRRQGQNKNNDCRKEGVVVTMEILHTVFKMPLHKACQALVRVSHYMLL